MNLFEFIKNYLSISGVSQDQLDENVGKVLYTVMLSVMKEQSMDDVQAKKLEEAVALLKEDKKQEGIETMRTVFESNDAEAWRSSFVEKLIEYLLDMTDKMADSLTEDKKKQLAGLINGLAS
jgi:uncharacterized membrane protein YvbJ